MSITLTQKHLIYISNRNGYLTADRVKQGDMLKVYNNNTNTMVTSKVIYIDKITSDGFITPLTDNGVILVNNVHASCFAHVTSHRISLISMKPMVIFYKILKKFGTFTILTGTTESNGIHLYAQFLYNFARLFFPFILC